MPIATAAHPTLLEVTARYLEKYPHRLGPETVKTIFKEAARTPSEVTINGREFKRPRDLYVLCHYLSGTARLTNRQAAELIGRAESWAKQAAIEGARIVEDRERDKAENDRRRRMRAEAKKVGPWY
jgi:hypothetical protein